MTKDFIPCVAPPEDANELSAYWFLMHEGKLLLDTSSSSVKIPVFDDTPYPNHHSHFVGLLPATTVLYHSPITTTAFDSSRSQMGIAT